MAKICTAINYKNCAANKRGKRWFADQPDRVEGSCQAELIKQELLRQVADLSQLLCTDPGDCLGSPTDAATVCTPAPRMGSCAVLGVAPQVCERSGTENGGAGTPPRRVL